MSRLVDVDARIPALLMQELLSEGDLQRFLHLKGAPVTPAQLPSEGRFILDLNGKKVQFAIGYGYEDENKKIEAVLVTISPRAMPPGIVKGSCGGWLLFSRLDQHLWTATKLHEENASDYNSSHSWKVLAQIALRLQEAEEHS